MAKRVMYDKTTGQMYVGDDKYMGYNEGQVSYIGADADGNVVAVPTAPLQKPATVIPYGGGVRATGLKPTLHRTVTQPTTYDELGTRDYLDVTDNTLAANVLVANTPAVWSTIWQYTVPVTRKLHFKPQNWQARDANCPSFLLMMYSDTTGATEVYGRYQIRVENSNQSGTKGILASGTLAEFALPAGAGIGSQAVATLNDVQNKVYYTEDYESVVGDIIQIRILTLAGVTINVNRSQVFLGHYVYVP